MVHPPATAIEGGIALYARVSSVDQKPDLERQMRRLICRKRTCFGVLMSMRNYQGDFDASRLCH